MSSVCSQEVTACFTSTSTINRLQARCFLVGPILPTALVTGYGATSGRLWTILPTVPNSCPVTELSEIKAERLECSHSRRTGWLHESKMIWTSGADKFTSREFDLLILPAPVYNSTHAVHLIHSKSTLSSQCFLPVGNLKKRKHLFRCVLIVAKSAY